MSQKSVQKTQELRRSSAAQPIPGKRACDMPWIHDWDDCAGWEDDVEV